MEYHDHAKAITDALNELERLCVKGKFRREASMAIDSVRSRLHSAMWWVRRCHQVQEDQ